MTCVDQLRMPSVADLRPCYKDSHSHSSGLDQMDSKLMYHSRYRCILNRSSRRRRGREAVRSFENCTGGLLRHSKLQMHLPQAAMCHTETTLHVSFGH